MKPAWTRSLRTGLQVALSILPALPFLVDALGIDKTAGLGAGLILVSATAARIMAVPIVDEWIDKILGRKD